MKIKLYIVILLGVSIISPAIQADNATTQPYVYFISPSNGEVIQSPVLVKFGLRGMGVAPAGIDKENTGHHHLLINLENLPALDKPIPADDQHKHFGKGQTEAYVELAPGTHTLQLLFADFSHIPHDPAVVSKPITIHVVE